jgi:hypothetical protein
MSTTLNLISQTNLAGIPLLPLLRDALYGIFGLILILLLHGSAINFIMLRFERLTNGNLKVRQYNRVFFHFYFTFFFIALIHLTEIIIWTIYILELNLIEDGIKAMIFVGSCYTTIGFIEDILPAGWKSLAFFISFSGLFAMAWTTSVMISMTSTYKSAWNLKHHQRDPNAS